MTTAPHPDQAATQEPSAASDHVVDVAQLVRELDVAFDHFPEKTLRDCQKHRQLVTPALIDVLHDAARIGQDGTVREGNAPLFAVYLLAEFETQESLPALFEFLSLPNNVPETLLGDAITEDLPRILAILAVGHDNRLDELIGNDSLNQYVRSAALRAYNFLVRDKQIERSAAVARLRTHLQRMIADDRDLRKDDVYLITSIIMSLANVNGFEAETEIHEAFERHLVDGWFIREEDVTESFFPDEPDTVGKFDRLPPTEIEDTVEEMRHWHWEADSQNERPELNGKAIFRALMDRLTNSLLPGLPAEDTVEEPVFHHHNIPHEATRVGRNDPCPCGSGKKYKKCCLRQHLDE